MSLAAPTSSRLNFPTLAAGLVGFVVLGMLQAIYGPSFPFLQRRYGVSSTVVAWVASAHFLGSALGPLLAGAALTRLSARRVVNAGVLTLLLGVLTVAFAPWWVLALLGALVAGLGLGVISAALNTGYANLGTRPANLVNAMFGVGSFLSPLLVSFTAQRSLSIPFVVVAALSGLIILTVWRWNVPEIPERQPLATENSTSGQTLWLLVLFPLILVAYVGLEAGFGAWIGQHLTSLGWRDPALVISGFWGGLTLGRLLTGAFGGRFQPPHLVLGAALCTLVCALLARLVPTWATGAYLLAGLALGPVFGTTLVWLSQVLAPRFVPFLLVSGSLGGMISPALIGWVVGQGGAGLIPLVLAALALLLTLAVLVTLRVTAMPITKNPQE